MPAHEATCTHEPTLVALFVWRLQLAIYARRLLSGAKKKVASLCPLAKKSMGYNVATIAEMFLKKPSPFGFSGSP
jgi:hypothetical protein